MALDENKPPECLECIWPCLKLWRLFGIAPVSRQGHKLITTAYLPWIPTILGVGIQIILIVKHFKWLLEFTGTVDDLLMQWTVVIYYFQTSGTLIFIIWKIQYIPKFLEACENVEVICEKYKEPNEHLVRDCNGLFYFYTFMQVVGNALYYWSAGKDAKYKHIDIPTMHILAVT